jgi:hypothetical protein
MHTARYYKFLTDLAYMCGIKRNINSLFADTNRSVEFYDFLQVNVSSSETKCGSSIEEQEENRDDDDQQAEGQVALIDFMEVGTSHQ